MKMNGIKLVVLSLSVSLAGLACADSWSRADAEALLATWTDAIVRYQVKGLRCLVPDQTRVPFPEGDAPWASGGPLTRGGRG